MTILVTSAEGGRSTRTIEAMPQDTGNIAASQPFARLSDDETVQPAPGRLLRDRRHAARPDGFSRRLPPPLRNPSQPPPPAPHGTSVPSPPPHRPLHPPP